MYHAFLALRPNTRLFSGFTYTSICDPGGAMGVASKWNSPSMAAHADSFGLSLWGRTMLTLRSHCSSNLHQYDMGKDGGSEAVIDLKHDLYVCTAFSAGAQCLPGAVYCRLVFCALMKSSTSLDVSLSILWSFGLNPLDSHHLYTFW